MHSGMQICHDFRMLVAPLIHSRIGGSSFSAAGPRLYYTAARSAFRSV